MIAFVALSALSHDLDSRSSQNSKEVEALNARVSALENQLKQKNAQSPIETKADAQTGAPEVANEQTQADGGLVEVASITDGDTIKVNLGGTIETLRLIGMDTPETLDPRKPVQCFGKEASEKARELLGNRNVRLEADLTQGERDQYGRLLRYVFLEDGTFFNQKMIEEGYAHEYTFQSKPYKYQTDFKNAEKSARENKRGLWAADTCNGDTEKAASANESVAATGSSDASGSGVVKKSSTGICHAPGTSYYEKTKSYTPFNSIDECLASGGRLPKR